jgi:hypothetical protein
VAKPLENFQISASQPMNKLPEGVLQYGKVKAGEGYFIAC